MRGFMQIAPPKTGFGDARNSDANRPRALNCSESLDWGGQLSTEIRRNGVAAR